MLSMTSSLHIAFSLYTIEHNILHFNDSDINDEILIGIGIKNGINSSGQQYLFNFAFSTWTNHLIFLQYYSVVCDEKHQL